jgi:quinol monooxygenase YgiN
MIDVKVLVFMTMTHRLRAEHASQDIIACFRQQTGCISYFAAELNAPNASSVSVMANV